MLETSAIPIRHGVLAARAILASACISCVAYLLRHAWDCGNDVFVPDRHSQASIVELCQRPAVDPYGTGGWSVSVPDA
jgi:hypothetical protein